MKYAINDVNLSIVFLKTNTMVLLYVLFNIGLLAAIQYTMYILTYNVLLEHIQKHIKNSQLMCSGYCAAQVTFKS